MGLGMGRIATQLIGKYTSDRVQPYQLQRKMGSFVYPERVAGTLLLTDKRLLLVSDQLFFGHGHKSVFTEIMFDPDLTREVVKAMSAHDHEVWRQYDSASFFSKTKVLSNLWGGVPVFTGIAVKKGVFRDRVVFTVNHLYFGGPTTRKKDLANPNPVKDISPANAFRLEIKAPWTYSRKIGAADLLLQLPLFTTVARHSKVKIEEYNPMLDIAQERSEPMVNVIRELSGNLAFEPVPK